MCQFVSYYRTYSVQCSLQAQNIFFLVLFLSVTFSVFFSSFYINLQLLTRLKNKTKKQPFTFLPQHEVTQVFFSCFCLFIYLVAVERRQSCKRSSSASTHYSIVPLLTQRSSSTFSVRFLHQDVSRSISDIIRFAFSVLEKEHSCLQHPDPRSDGVLPFKSTEDTKIVSLLLSLFPSGDRNCYFAVVVPFPLLTFPIILFFNPTYSEQTSRSGSDTAKTTSGFQSRMQHPRQKRG